MPRTENAHLWLAEPLMLDPSYIGRKMFGCEAVYIQGLLVLVLADTEDPWNGILVPTEKLQHPEIVKDFPDLRPHPVLPKWLYLPADLDTFEPVAQRLVRQIASGDGRFGVLPKPKTKKNRRAASSPKAKHLKRHWDQRKPRRPGQ